MITIKELADKLGVSTTTISNVIHGKTGEVSQATIETVQRAVRDYNYIPNMSARALAQKSSRIIGVVLKFNPQKELNALQDPFAGELMGALEASIREAGYYMMQYVAPNVGDIVRLMKTWNVDGLVLSGFHAQDYKQIRAQTQKPMVFVDCYFGDVGIPYSNVGLEDQTGGRIMTEYLISLGHERIAYLSDNRIGNDWMRWLGYCEAMEQPACPTARRRTTSACARDGRNITRAWPQPWSRAIALPRYSSPRIITPCVASITSTTTVFASRRISPWPALTITS